MDTLTYDHATGEAVLRIPRSDAQSGNPIFVTHELAVNTATSLAQFVQSVYAAGVEDGRAGVADSIALLLKVQDRVADVMQTVETDGWQEARMWSDAVKARAYVLDPECWVSYSGKPKHFKQVMDLRRTAALKNAKKEVERT